MTGKTAGAKIKETVDQEEYIEQTDSREQHEGERAVSRVQGNGPERVARNCLARVVANGEARPVIKLACMIVH